MGNFSAWIIGKTKAKRGKASVGGRLQPFRGSHPALGQFCSFWAGKSFGIPGDSNQLSYD